MLTDFNGTTKARNYGSVLHCFVDISSFMN